VSLLDHPLEIRIDEVVAFDLHREALEGRIQ
jgi:hypothetical protein